MKVKKLIGFFFVLTYALKFITDGMFVAKEVNSIFISFKYVTMFIVFILFAIQKRGRFNLKKMCFLKETKTICFVILSFLFLSIIFIILNGKLTMNTISLLIKMFLSISFAFVILNSLDMEDIYRYMKIILVFAILGYVLEIGIDNFSNFTLSSMNFATSYSPFESSYFAGAFLSLSAFFCYFRKEKKWMIISIIFSIRTFKRLAILFSLLLLIIPWFIKIDSKISKKYLLCFAFIFVILTYGYNWLLEQKNADVFYDIFGQTQSEFTMTRSDRLHELSYRNFESYGYGSAATELGLELIEMDLVEILMELTIIGLIIFCVGYWSITNGQIYCCIFMTFHFMNFLTSHSLAGNFSWTLNFLIIGSILYKTTKGYIGKRPRFINSFILRKKDKFDRKIDGNLNESKQY